MPRADYDSHRLDMAQRQRERRAVLGDIGEIPPIADPERRARCGKSLREFCETYRPAAFYLKWSDDHIRVIDRMQATVIDGGLFGLAMPRGSGKTTLVVSSAIWALLYGLRRWVCLIGATQPKAVSLVRSIKMELRFNDLLAADFPEVVVPIRALEGRAARSGSQTYRGESTHISWQVDELTLPTIAGSAGSGGRITAAGITGDIRGQQETLADGTVARPDYILLDDPQTRESARSASQTNDRLATLNGDILGLAGPGIKISGVMPCTVIQKGDLADQILDREASPAWHGERTQLLYGMPSNTDLWEQYRSILEADLRNDGNGSIATDFYRANREEMDKGAKAAWPERHNPDEVSGVQHAMNLFLRDEGAFWAEYQNSPIELAEVGMLSVEDLAARVNGYERGIVPAEAEVVTAMVDVQKDLLFYTVAAWRKDFSGWVVEYGAWPDQRTTNFRLNQTRNTIGRKFPGASLEDSTQRALLALTNELCGRSWARDDGAEMFISKLLIDANWGATRDVVYRFARNSPHRAVIDPCHGRYVGAGSQPINATHVSKMRGKDIGTQWRIAKAKDSPVRHVLFDSNYWKTFVHSRLAAEPNTAGSLTLYKASPVVHKTFASHLRAETPIRTEGRGREVDEWKIRPDRPDNHWLDCIVGCAVAASVAGCSLSSARPRQKPKRKREAGSTGVTYL
jgi:hypothetical protein